MKLIKRALQDRMAGWDAANVPAMRHVFNPSRVSQLAQLLYCNIVQLSWWCGETVALHLVLF